MKITQNVVFNFIQFLFRSTNYLEQFWIADCGLVVSPALYLFLLNRQNTLFLRIFKASGQIQKRISDGFFATEFSQRLNLEDVPKGLVEYINQMTAGKILILSKNG